MLFSTWDLQTRRTDRLRCSKPQGLLVPRWCNLPAPWLELLGLPDSGPTAPHPAVAPQPQERRLLLLSSLQTSLRLSSALTPIPNPSTPLATPLVGPARTLSSAPSFPSRSRSPPRSQVCKMSASCVVPGFQVASPPPRPALRTSELLDHRADPA